MKKKVILFVCAIICMFAIASCGSNGSGTGPTGGTTADDIETPTPATGNSSSTDVTSDTTKEGTFEKDPELTYVSIVFGEEVTVVDNDGSVVVDGKNITIQNTVKTGYILSGTLNGGHIACTSDKGVVLVLNGCSITSTDTAAIYKTGKKKLTIVLPAGSNSYVEDGSTYSTLTSTVEAIADVNSCVYAKNGIEISGSGTLQVKGNYNNGIGSKDEVEISEATLIIDSKDNAIKGNDYVSVVSGTITVESDSDAIKADNDELVDSDSGDALGYITISGGEFNLTSVNDGIQASNYIEITGGEFNLTCGGGYTQTTTGEDSHKGIKAVVSLTISGGTFNISSADDTLHSNGTITITGGTYKLTSGDDGIHADSILTISGGEIVVTKAYEGIESEKIYLNGGNISLFTTDDGVNAAGGNDSSSPTGGWGQSSNTGVLEINSPTVLYINAAGDGLDANGTITMNGGNVRVDGQTKGGNGAIDYESSFVLNGGSLFTVEVYDGMQTQTVSSANQYCMMVGFTTSYSSGATVVIKDSSGNEIASYITEKAFSAMNYSSESLTSGTYSIFINGSKAIDVTLGSTYLVTAGNYQSTQPGMGPGTGGHTRP